MHSHYLPDHDACLRYHRIGTVGPTVLWLPGLSMPAAGNFLHTASAPCLPPIRSILVDTLGTGLSDAPNRPLVRVAEFADTIASLLDYLGETALTVIGYSFGGAVAVELASRRPDLVQRLILAEANLFPGGGVASRGIAAQTVENFTAEGLAELLEELRGPAREGEIFASFVRGSLATADPAALHGASTALVNIPDDMAQRLFDLPIRRSYIYGENSLTAEGTAKSSDQPDPAVLKAAGITVRVLAGTGHDMMITDPEGFAQILSDLLPD